jgi:hypothetical protein
MALSSPKPFPGKKNPIEKSKCHIIIPRCHSIIHEKEPMSFKVVKTKESNCIWCKSFAAS